MMMIIAPIIEAMWRKVVESPSSRTADQMADNALNSMNNMKDFEHIFENLKKNLHALSARAADFEEQITNQVRSGQKKRKYEVEVWFKEVKSIKDVFVRLESEMESEGFVTMLTKGGKAAQLDKQVEKLVEQSRYFNELVHDVCGTSGEAFLTRGLVGKAFGENVEKILRLLESGEVSSIGLYGMGGVGKTTLAKHINNRLKQNPERRVYWVTVSQEFTVKGLQDKIAGLLGLDLSGGVEVGQRAMRLQTELSQQKSSVLILDDVWDNIKLSDVGCDSSVDGCKLIITTRSVAVCQGIGCQEEIPVEKLDEGEAWKLFRERLGNKIELVPEIEEIAKDVVKLCGGLPLAIITVARTMRGKRGSRRWRNAFVELQERVKGNDDGTVKDEVFEVLKFSFDRLKEENDNNIEFNMKQLCFLYCSLYPEDYQINRGDLVRKFISDGLLDERRSRRARFDQGHSILDELVEVCLLESCVDYNGKECVKMHDLVRGMALMICKGKYMVRAGEWSFLKEILDEEEWTEDLEKVSFMSSCIRRIGEGFSPDCPKLSTLLLWGNPWLKVIPESFLSKMQGLCTLDLCGNLRIAMLPGSISDLICLKSLHLEGCKKLKSVPYLGKMKALRELNLSRTAIKEAPRGLEELLNLRFLSMNALGLKMLPRGVLLKLVHLEHLHIPVDIQVSTEEIENLKRLEELSGGVKSVSGFNKFVRSGGDDPCYRILVSKKVVGSIAWELLYNRLWPEGPNNNELELHTCDLKDEKVLGKGIAWLTISSCEGLSKWFVDDLWERFDNPTSLKKLDIRGCRGIEWIMRSEGCQLLSTLEQIELSGLNDLKGVVGVMERERGEIGASAAQPPVFSSLKKLSISWCNKMRKVGLPALSSSLPNLELISISDCEELEDIFEDEDEGRAADSITLPKLRVLRLSNLPRLKRVSKATIISNSIQEIKITECPELKNRLPLGFDDQAAPPPSLTKGYVRVERGWWESLEWDNPLLPQLLHPEFEDDSEEFEDDSEDQ